VRGLSDQSSWCATERVVTDSGRCWLAGRASTAAPQPDPDRYRRSQQLLEQALREGEGRLHVGKLVVLGEVRVSLRWLLNDRPGDREGLWNRRSVVNCVCVLASGSRGQDVAVEGADEPAVRRPRGLHRGHPRGPRRRGPHPGQGRGRG
jgi:hypothetical protein